MDSSFKFFAKNMRCFHNKVKSRLISKGVDMTDGKTLLDIGCGRGGDLYKWEKCALEYVYAYDPNPAYIEEATRRLNSSNLNCNYEFSTKMFKGGENCFDIVSCQFAVHYLFESDDTLNEHLKYVACMLKPGGVYIGTCVDGDSVIERVSPLHYNYFSNKAVCIRVPYMDKIRQETGVPLNVHLAGTLYFGEKSISHEFVVKKDVLTRRCEAVGLRLVSYTPFKEYNAEMNFKMGSDFSDCSYMYTSFMFEKKST